MNFWQYCQELEQAVGPDVVIEKIVLVRQWWGQAISVRTLAEYLREVCPVLCRPELSPALVAAVA